MTLDLHLSFLRSLQSEERRITADAPTQDQSGRFRVGQRLCSIWDEHSVSRSEVQFR